MRCGSLALVLGDYKMSEIRTSSYVWPQIHMRTLLIMAIQVVEFQTGGTKLERFLPKNQHTQRKLLNFENWVNREVSRSAKI